MIMQLRDGERCKSERTQERPERLFAQVKNSHFMSCKFKAIPFTDFY